MLSAFQSDKTYNAGEFCCQICAHRTLIFIDTKYNMFGFSLSNEICCFCKQEKDVTDADLILRYDWSDADDNPWQLQGATMQDKDRYCKKCSYSVVRDWKKFIVPCSKCIGYMEFSS